MFSKNIPCNKPDLLYAKTVAITSRKNSLLWWHVYLWVE